MRKFKIDDKIVEETTNCQHSFACLDGNFSHCGGVVCQNDALLCKTPFNPSFCFYRIRFLPTGNICGCYTRKEIFKKYGL